MINIDKSGFCTDVIKDKDIAKNTPEEQKLLGVVFYALNKFKLNHVSMLDFFTTIEFNKRGSRLSECYIISDDKIYIRILTNASIYNELLDLYFSMPIFVDLNVSIVNVKDYFKDTIYNTEVEIIGHDIECINAKISEDIQNYFSEDVIELLMSDNTEQSFAYYDIISFDDKRKFNYFEFSYIKSKLKKN